MRCPTWKKINLSGAEGRVGTGTVPTWEDFYEQHPGWTIFDDRYENHIININDMIQEICRQNLYPIYQFGNSGKLAELIVRQHPKLIDKLMRDGEREFNRMLEENVDEMVDETEHELEIEDVISDEED